MFIALPINFDRFMKPFNIVALGRFLESNSIEVALKAYATFYHSVKVKDQKRTSITLIDKKYNQNLNKEYAEICRIEKKVSYLTLQEQDDIEKTYREGSLLLLPRIINSSSIIKESFLFGLPVMCYVHPSHNNLIDPSNSMCVAYQNDTQAVEAFSKNLILLNHDPEAVDFLRKGAQAKYEKDLSWGKRAQAV